MTNTPWDLQTFNKETKGGGSVCLHLVLCTFVLHIFFFFFQFLRGAIGRSILWTLRPMVSVARFNPSSSPWNSCLTLYSLAHFQSQSGDILTGQRRVGGWWDGERNGADVGLSGCPGTNNKEGSGWLEFHAFFSPVDEKKMSKVK